jgi:hypothetical protein
VPPTLARTLRSTNAIESMISVCRQHAANVKRWRDGQMALRWCAAGMVEAGKQASSSAASTATCTYRNSGQHSNANSPNLSNPPCTMTR